MAIYSWFTHWKCWFSIVMLVYQRVFLLRSMWTSWFLCLRRYVNPCDLCMQTLIWDTFSWLVVSMTVIPLPWFLIHHKQGLYIDNMYIFHKTDWNYSHIILYMYVCTYIHTHSYYCPKLLFFVVMLQFSFSLFSSGHLQVPSSAALEVARVRDTLAPWRHGFKGRNTEK